MNTNLSVNFILKGLSSICIGFYFLIGSYLMKLIITPFLIEDYYADVTSVFLLVAVVFLVFVFSILTLYYFGNKAAKKQNIRLWNAASKTVAKKFFTGIIILFLVLFILLQFNFYNYLTPTFLILYGFLLYFLRQNQRKGFIIIASLCLFLGIICFLIPSYWYSSLTILGIAHITYGVVVT